MLSDNEIAGLLNPLYRWSNLIFCMLIQVIKVKRLLKSFGWAWSKMIVASLFTGLYYWLHQEWIGELNWFIYANSGKLFPWFLGERGQKEAWQLDPTVKLEASSCNSTEDNAPPCVFFFSLFLNWANGTKSCKSIRRRCQFNKNFQIQSLLSS